MTSNRLRVFLGLFFLHAAAAMILYARALPYEFVFDDHNRIEKNVAIHSLNPVSRFFLDPKTQSSDGTLPRHTYRPLVSLSFALDYSLWKENPAFYRLENILLHALNAALVAWIAVLVFSLPLPIAVLSSMMFLVHPLQTEAVVWIAGRSDVLSVSFLLLTWAAWVAYTDIPRAPRLAAVVLCFSAALFTREIAILAPLMLALGDAARAPASKPTISPARRRILYGVFAATALAFVAARSAMLGQTGQKDLWGGTPTNNLANVLAVWPLYLQKFLWPFKLRVEYWSLPILFSWTMTAWAGLFSLLVFLLSIALLWRIHRPLSVALLLFVVFWVPGSNIVPLATQFAERLLYPMVIFLSIAVGLIAQAVLRQDRRPATATAVGAVLLSLDLLLLGVSWVNLPVWRNDATLWRNVVHREPENWWAWYMKGATEVDRARLEPADEKLWLGKAKTSYICALRLGMPAAAAGATFIHAAIVADRLGQPEEARILSTRGLALRPDLSADWEARRPPAAGD